MFRETFHSDRVCATVVRMVDPLGDEYLARFSEAVVQEIWNEMGRQRITSLRELARRAGMTHTSINVRMNGDSRTGKQVTLNVRDLAAIGNALGVEPGRLVDRAQDAMNAETDPLVLDKQAAVDLAARRKARRYPAVQEEAARREDGDD